MLPDFTSQLLKLFFSVHWQILKKSWKIFWVEGKVLFWFCPFENSFEFYLIFFKIKERKVWKGKVVANWKLKMLHFENGEMFKFWCHQVDWKVSPSSHLTSQKWELWVNTLQQKGPWTSSCEVTVSWGQSASPGRHTGPDLQRDLGTKRYREVQSGIYKSTWAR